MGEPKDSDFAGDPLKSMAWMLENQARVVIPNLETLDAKAIAQGLQPGIYTLVGPNDSRAYLTLQTDGTARLWNLNYDPEYLERAYRGEGLKHLGKKALSHGVSAEEAEYRLPKERGIVPDGQVSKHGNKHFCGVCMAGK